MFNQEELGIIHTAIESALTEDPQRFNDETRPKATTLKGKVAQRMQQAAASQQLAQSLFADLNRLPTPTGDLRLESLREIDVMTLRALIRIVRDMPNMARTQARSMVQRQPHRFIR